MIADKTETSKEMLFMFQYVSQSPPIYSLHETVLLLFGGLWPACNGTDSNSSRGTEGTEPIYHYYTYYSIRRQNSDSVSMDLRFLEYVMPCSLVNIYQCF
jgi:hypothetical protein